MSVTTCWPSRPRPHLRLARPCIRSAVGLKPGSGTSAITKVSTRPGTCVWTHKHGVGHRLLSRLPRWGYAPTDVWSTTDSRVFVACAQTHHKKLCPYRCLVYH